MTALTAIRVTIMTEPDSGSGTDGRIYLGICGREFRCDTDDDDFEPGSDRTYIFGEGSNIRRPDLNDPRQPALVLEDRDLFPVYLRFDQADSDDWFINQAWVYLNGNTRYDYSILLSSDGLWLGGDSGSFFHLHKLILPRSADSPPHS